jgi:hypothetical protein
MEAGVTPALCRNRKSRELPLLLPLSAPRARE